MPQHRTKRLLKRRVAELLHTIVTTLFSFVIEEQINVDRALYRCLLNMLDDRVADRERYGGQVNKYPIINWMAYM